MTALTKSACAVLSASLALGCAPAATTAQPSIVFNGVRWGSQSISPRIYLIHADGTGLRRITNASNVEDTAPAWRPDRKLIVFGRSTMRGSRLYVISPQGRGLRPVTPALSLAGSPAWSPDGRRLAFDWMPRPVPWTFAQQIAVIDGDGSGLRQLTRYSTFKGGASHAAWAPDGRTILFVGRKSVADGSRADVWSVRPNGRGLRRLIANATDPAWSPEGRRIAFSRGGDLYTATPAGRVLRRLTHGSYADSVKPVWSPDGRQILYSTAHYDRSKSEVAECLTLIGADGSGRHEITRRNPDFWAATPDWR